MDVIPSVRASGASRHDPPRTSHDGGVALRADLLAAAERSPAAAAAHDRAAWVGLFAETGVVEDPVGSRPHRGHDEIARFYDTFIGPRDIVFHRDHDVVVGEAVIRDLTLEVRMAASSTMLIPAYLRYDVTAAGDRLVIARLRAYWELPAMVGRFARTGLAAVPAGLTLARNLLANQGVGGAAGFAAGALGTGVRGRRAVTDLLDDLCAGDEVAVRRRLAAGATATLGDDHRIPVSDLVARLRGGHWRQPIAAGPTVAARVTTPDGRGVVFAEPAPDRRGVARLRLFAG